MSLISRLVSISMAAQQLNNYFSFSEVTVFISVAWN